MVCELYLSKAVINKTNPKSQQDLIEGNKANP